MKNKTNIINIFLVFLISLAAISTISRTAQAENPDPIFQESFESLDAVVANGASFHDNLTFEPGKTGNGVRISGKGNLKYPAAGKVDIHKGTLEFWIKPDWDGSQDLCGTGTGTGTIPSLKYFLSIFDGNTIYATSSNHTLILPVEITGSKCHEGQPVQNYFDPSFNYHKDATRKNYSKEPYTVMSWKPGTWHKVVLYWDFTLPDSEGGKHNSYFVTKIDDLYTDVVNAAPLGPEDFKSDDPVPSNNAVIVFGQDHVLGRYSADAVFDDFKIYDHSLLPVVPFPAYKFNPDNPDTAATFRQLFAADGFCSDFENYNNDPGECPKIDDSVKPGQNVLFFEKPAFERVYEKYIPKESEIGSQFSYQAALGEYEDFFFNTYSKINLNNVKVNYTDFRGSAGIIPKENFEIRVVKNWFQGANDESTLIQQLPSYVPELLLQNDQIALDNGPYTSANVPSMPAMDHVETKIDQFTSKQFAIVAHIPEDATPGQYSANVTLSADGISDQTIKIDLDVLPFKLKDSGKIFSIWHYFEEAMFNKPGAGRDDFTRKYFTDIKNHGFDTVFLYDGWFSDWGTKFDVVANEVKIASEVGIKRVVPYLKIENISAAYKNMLTSYGFEPWFYGSDEIGEGTNPDHLIAEQIQKSQIIHNMGAKVVTTGTQTAFERLTNTDDPIYKNNFPAGTEAEPADWAIYPLYPVNYFSDLETGKVQKNSDWLESYYWQSRSENPQTNRYRCGYFLWNTGLDACQPTFYMGRIGNDGNIYYNDFDYPAPDKMFRPYMMAYPTKEGMVPTFQWEATREGVDDTRYLATWEYYKNIAAKNDLTAAQQSENTVKSILNRYNAGFPYVLNGTYRVPMSQYEADRRTIAAEIEKMQAAAGPIFDADINADSKIDATDLGILKTDFLKLTANLANLKSDINGDGQATVKDVGILMSQWKP